MDNHFFFFFGRPPSLPLRRAAADFAPDFTLPPIAPRADIAALTVSGSSLRKSLMLSNSCASLTAAASACMYAGAVDDSV